MNRAVLTYPVIAQEGALASVSEHLSPATKRVAIITSQDIAEIASQAIESVTNADRDAKIIEVPPGESAKDLAVANKVWAELAAFGVTRSDAIIGVGGGATTDLAGFIAGTWMRGVDVIYCPTTLLAMVDAAIGGKTGINTDQGKNLVGVFHDPIAVVCDSFTLHSLPEAEFRSGFAEIIKSGLIGDSEILNLIEVSDEADLLSPGPTLDTLIRRSVDVKAAVVAADPREKALSGVGRAALNYGHTFGHAIEKSQHYQLRHGEAISIGMSFAAALGQAANVTSALLAQRQAALLSKLGLPTRFDAAPLGEIVEIAKLDKKNRAELLRFIVLRDIGDVEFLEAPSQGLLEEAWLKIQ